MTGVVMFAPSSQDPNLSGRYSLSEVDASVHSARAIDTTTLIQFTLNAKC